MITFTNNDDIIDIVDTNKPERKAIILKKDITIPKHKYIEMITNEKIICNHYKEEVIFIGEIKDRDDIIVSSCMFDEKTDSDLIITITNISDNDIILKNGTSIGKLNMCFKFSPNDNEDYYLPVLYKGYGIILKEYKNVGVNKNMKTVIDTNGKVSITLDLDEYVEPFMI